MHMPGHTHLRDPGIAHHWGKHIRTTDPFLPRSSPNHTPQAVLYFQRALNLDPNCLEAWTLIGHEYLEMKNPNAAIEAYRRAVDVNAKDFRAWYGLGQTYEMLVMPYYALFYYRKAAQLRPNDARMWVRPPPPSRSPPLVWRQ